MTNSPPAPTILSTAGTVSVPYAIAPIACAAAQRKQPVDPRHVRRGQDQVVYLALLGFGGVQTITVSTPATRAGMADMSSEEGSGAVPPGT